MTARASDENAQSGDKYEIILILCFTINGSNLAAIIQWHVMANVISM